MSFEKTSGSPNKNQPFPKDSKYMFDQQVYIIREAFVSDNTPMRRVISLSTGSEEILTVKTLQNDEQSGNIVVVTDDNEPLKTVEASVGQEVVVEPVEPPTLNSTWVSSKSGKILNVSASAKIKVANKLSADKIIASAQLTILGEKGLSEDKQKELEKKLEDLLRESLN